MQRAVAWRRLELRNFVPATLVLVGVLGSVMIGAPPAFAGVGRNDVPASQYLQLGSSTLYASVGRIAEATANGNYSGSGTLIAPNWVLTAAHMVDDATALTLTFGGVTYTADKWVANPSWTGNLGAGYDLGLIHLTKAVTGITPATRYTGSSELGKVATFVGYGMTGVGSTGATTFDGRKRAGQNTIDRLQAGTGANSRLFLADFDNPTNSRDSTYGSSKPLGLEYLIAPGDSGGGVFVDFGTGPQLVGVNSFGMAYDGKVNSDYGDLSGHIRVSPFNGWINSVIGTTATAASTTTLSTRGVDPANTIRLPEPSTFVLGSLGLFGLATLAVRRRKS